MHQTSGESRQDWLAKQRFPRWLVVIHLGVTLAACAPASEPVTAIVVEHVVDGDTIVVSFGGRTHETVRLLGIDTPETVDPSRPEQCYGKQASDFLRSLLPAGTTVVIERDVEARDHFGRLLGYVFRAEDHLFVNQVLLEHGFADLSIYEPNSTYETRLSAAVVAARTRNIGLWNACGGADVAIDPPPITLD